MEKRLRLINVMLPQLLKSCQFRVMSLFSRCLKKKTMGLWVDKCVRVPLPPNPPLPSALSQPPLHLAASSHILCIYCRAEKTTEVQRRIHSGCRWPSLSLFFLPPTSPSSRNFSSLDGTVSVFYCEDQTNTKIIKLIKKCTHLQTFILLIHNVMVLVVLCVYRCVTYKTDVGLRDNVR